MNTDLGREALQDSVFQVLLKLYHGYVYSPRTNCEAHTKHQAKCYRDR